MHENTGSAPARCSGVGELLERWLLARQELLVIYAELAAINEFSDNDPEQGARVQAFSQALVDYVSSWHYEVYRRLLREGQEHLDGASLAAADALFQQIAPTTEQALDFNDKYLAVDDLSSLTRDLSQLGEALGARFEAEDRIIANLHTASQRAAAP